MVEPTWESRELPVLRAIVEALEEHPDSEVRPPELAERSGLALDEVDRGLKKLWVANPPYFQGIAVESDTIPICATRVMERGLRESGQWPSAESVVDALAAAFQQAAEAEPDTERRTRLQAAADSLRGFARDVAVGVISTKLSGL